MDYLICMYVLERESGPIGSQPSFVISSLYGAGLGWAGLGLMSNSSRMDGWRSFPILLDQYPLVILRLLFSCLTWHIST